jgi:hypothetical protein
MLVISVSKRNKVISRDFVSLFYRDGIQVEKLYM